MDPDLQVRGSTFLQLVFESAVFGNFRSHFAIALGLFYLCIPDLPKRNTPIIRDVQTGAVRVTVTIDP